MLAARRSFGSLRSAARAQQCAAPAGTVAVPQRSFMSAVLLSRDQFSSKTVVELKKQLSERGLSTKGRKKELVDRLVESVSKGTFGPSSSSSASASSRISPSQTSSFSTTSKAGAASPTAAGSTVESASVPVHAPASEAAANAPSDPGEAAQDPAASDELTAGPGLVVNKQEAAHVAEKAEEVPGGSIEMPRAVYLPSIERDIRESQHEMMIPEMPHTYKNPVNHDAGAQPFTLHPSWIKVDASTSAIHHASGSNVTEDPDSRSSEPRVHNDSSDSSTFLQDILADLGIKPQTPRRAKKNIEKAQKEVAKQSSAILSLLEETSGVKIPPMSEPVKSKAPEFKFQDRPLNSQESTGLWTLAGILGGGLLLGTLGSGKKRSEAKGDERSTEH